MVTKTLINHERLLELASQIVTDAATRSPQLIPVTEPDVA